MRSTAPLRALALFAAALALSFAYAPFPFRFFAFAAFVPLLHLCDPRRPGRRLFLWGWLFGGLAAGFHFWWLWFLVVPVEQVTRMLLNLGVVLLFAYLGLFTAVFTLLVRRLGLWTAPLLWPLLEYLRTRGQIAFPWDLLGYTMTPWPAFTQPAALGGVFLVSSWLMLINVLLYSLLFNRRRIVTAAALVACFVLPLGFAALRMRPTGHWFSVAIVQPNVSPLDKGDLESRERIITDLLRMTRAAAESRPNLILYPETATLTDVTRSTTIGPLFQRLVDSLGIEVFTGSPLFDPTTKSWHNGAVLLRPGAFPPLQRYYKMRLVPFSEKIPYSDEVPAISRLLSTADMGDWARGCNPTVFDWSKGRLCGLICFEAIFPDLAREFTRRGADLIAVVTNDGWFGRVLGAQQHAELAVMRTVESGVPMIRSANNGISLVADPYGRVLARTQLFTQTILTGWVPRPTAPTPYRRLGDWFIVVCDIGLVVGLVLKAAGGRAARSIAR